MSEQPTRPANCDTLSVFEEDRMARRRGQNLGNLRNIGGRWQLRYRVDVIDPETGQVTRERLTHDLGPSKGKEAIGKREVQSARTAFMLSIDQTSRSPAMMQTLAEFIERRFQPDVVESNPVRKTQLYYRSTFRHILPTLGGVAMRDITPGKIQALINAKAEKYSKTVVNIRAVLSAVFTHARKMRAYQGELPTEGVRMPKRKRTPQQAMAWEQVCAIAKHLEEPYATLAVFLAITGLRPEEAAGLTWKHVNLTQQMQVLNGEVIPPLSVAVREVWVLGERKEAAKTEAGERNVPLPVWIVERLRVHLAKSAWRGPEHPVFVSRAGTPIDMDNARARHLKQAAALAGLGTPRMPGRRASKKEDRPAVKAQPAKSWVSWYTFRRTYATLIHTIGFTAAESMLIMGHTSPEVTHGYIKANLDRVRPLLDKLVEPKLLQ